MPTTTTCPRARRGDREDGQRVDARHPADRDNKDPDFFHVEKTQMIPVDTHRANRQFARVVGDITLRGITRP
jgi:hypothetical protein